MKGRHKFTNSEFQKIKRLINKKVAATSGDQKAIRAQIRSIGFYYSDFSPRKDGYTVTDFENLKSSGQIIVTDMATN